MKQSILRALTLQGAIEKCPILLSQLIAQIISQFYCIIIIFADFRIRFFLQIIEVVISCGKKVGTIMNRETNAVLFAYYIIILI